MYYLGLLIAIMLAVLLWLVITIIRPLLILRPYKDECAKFLDRLEINIDDDNVYVQIDMDILDTGYYVTYNRSAWKQLTIISEPTYIIADNSHKSTVAMVRRIFNKSSNPTFDGWYVMSTLNAQLKFISDCSNIEKKMKTLERDLRRLFGMTIHMNNAVDEAELDTPDHEVAKEFLKRKYSKVTVLTKDSPEPS